MTLYQGTESTTFLYAALAKVAREIPDSAFKVLFVFASHAKSDGTGSRPGFKLICRESGRCKSTVGKALAFLRRKKYIVRTGKHFGTDIYRINIPGHVMYDPDAQDYLDYTEQIEESIDTPLEPPQEEMVAAAVETATTDEDFGELIRHIKVAQLNGSDEQTIRDKYASFSITEQEISEVLYMSPNQLSLWNHPSCINIQKRIKQRQLENRSPQKIFEVYSRFGFDQEDFDYIFQAPTEQYDLGARPPGPSETSRIQGIYGKAKEWASKGVLRE